MLYSRIKMLCSLNTKHFKQISPEGEVLPECKDKFTLSTINDTATLTLTDSQGLSLIITCPMSYSELNSYFEHLDYNPRNCTTKMVVKAWKKAHQALHAIKGVKLCDPNQLAIDYLKRCFVIKSQMEWWIINCGSSGASDDYTKERFQQPVMLVEPECTTDRILEWICTRTFSERINYSHWDAPNINPNQEYYSFN